MSRCPAYVSALKKPGEVARLHDGTWFLSLRRSRRIDGCPTPQVYYEDTAIALPTGRKEILPGAERQELVLGEFCCHEFGYSYVLQSLCPAQWKASLGADWMMIFLDLISQESPDSYLLKDKTIVLPEDRYIHMQQMRFWEKLTPGLNQKIQPLKGLQIAFFPSQVCLAQPTPAHTHILDSLGISLTVGILL